MVCASSDGQSLPSLGWRNAAGAGAPFGLAGISVIDRIKHEFDPS